jgi:hypothetical protein
MLLKMKKLKENAEKFQEPISFFSPAQYWGGDRGAGSLNRYVGYL